MKKMKKILCLCLALVMCLSLVNLTALAADGDPWTDPSEFGSDAEVTTSETPVEGGTQTEWEYNVDPAPDNTETPDVDESHGSIHVEGIETVTETEGTNEAGLSGTTTTTEGKETITETVEGAETTEEGEPELGEDDPEWTTSDNTDEDGWKDVPEDPDPSEDPNPSEDPDSGKVENPPVTPNEDLDAEDGVTEDLTDPDEDGKLTGSVILGTVDKDELISEDIQGLTKDDETGMYTSEDGKTTATVTEGTDADGKNTITVEKIETEEVEYSGAPEFGEDGIAVEVTVPEGAEAVYSEDGTTVIGYKTEVNTIDADGNSVTTTTTTMVTVVEKTAGGAVTQKRTVTTTTYTIDKADKTLDVELDGKLEGTEETTKSTDILDETAKNEVEEIAKKDNSTTTVTTNEDLDAIAKAGYDAVTEDLSKENAEAVINAVLLNKVNGTTDFVPPETWTDAQKALYEKLNAMDVTDSKTEEVTEEKPLPDEAAPDADPVETAAPSVDISNATVKVVDITTGEDSATNYKATVSFTVSTLPQVDGSLTLTLTDDEGNVFEQTVAEGNLTKNPDGTYTVSVEVQLSGDAQNLTLNLTGSTTERTVYVVNAEVPGGVKDLPDDYQQHIDRTETGTGVIKDDKLNVYQPNGKPHDGNIELGWSFQFKEGNDKASHEMTASWHPGSGWNGDGLQLGKGDYNQIGWQVSSDNKKATITNNSSDQCLEIPYIMVKAGPGFVLYEVPNGKLYPGQSITVESIKNPGGNIAEFSHIGLIDGAFSKVETTPGQSGSYVRVDEIQKELNLSGQLNLTLNDILVGKKVETQDQVREGFATWNRQDKTEQVTIETVTVREWNRTDFTENNESEPPENPPENPPEENLPDEEPPLVDIPDEEPAKVETPTEETPVPVVELPDEQVPLVELPDEQLPMIEWPPMVVIPAEDIPAEDIPDEDVPLASVPQTGDYSPVWIAALVLSISGLAVLTLKKREDEEN